MHISLDPSFVFDPIKKLSVIQTVKSKLLRQNEPTAEQLAEVLNELAKMLSTFEDPRHG